MRHYLVSCMCLWSGKSYEYVVPSTTESGRPSPHYLVDCRVDFARNSADTVKDATVCCRQMTLFATVDKFLKMGDHL